jgi:plasmid stabilization system protein ParE
MLRPPRIHFAPRVKRDIEKLLAFIGEQPWGNVEARRQDIEIGIAKIASAALLRPAVQSGRDARGPFRRLNVGQIAIIYRYKPPSPAEPGGVVSIRAVRHANERDVFRGVREALPVGYAVPAS